MVFKNPDNPENVRTIENFDIIGVSGDVTADNMYINFISNPTPEGGTLEGSLMIRDFNHLKGLRDMLNLAVKDIERKISY